MVQRKTRHLADDGFLEFGYTRTLEPAGRNGCHFAILTGLAGGEHDRLAHSIRSATDGSMDAARIAGTMLASNVGTRSRRAEAIKVNK